MSSSAPNPKSSSRKPDLRWKTLVAYLPGMASVVNTFESPEVQLEVYKLLIGALDEKIEAEDGIPVTRGKTAPAPTPAKSKVDDSSAGGSKDVLAVDLAEGDSIHAMAFHP